MLQVGGGDRENLCSVCGTPCRDSSIFTSSRRLIGITSVFVLRTALKKWNQSLGSVRLKKVTPKITRVVSAGSTAHVRLSTQQAERAQEFARSSLSVEVVDCE